MCLKHRICVTTLGSLERDRHAKVVAEMSRHVAWKYKGSLPTDAKLAEFVKALHANRKSRGDGKWVPQSFLIATDGDRVLFMVAQILDEFKNDCQFPNDRELADIVCAVVERYGEILAQAGK